ncbi:hypothetical protein K437DRAFT_285267 [Tilletiaria anomala UBC 951]|uniref:Raptor N-terminal CASPase-like domain-containing protein n=1 Tax=Tilletiaria anomala (strain ATCC 24038 / CBS 436.72 / UBC 951) TaxID=1037660 RepID=A0A066VWR8_TILAU|nr:uncharacterized protein K437DRAFT_285267 [Tilletiaria anomala UBC 951]KDN45901.1 hypothetical protein K437DRAFT_285267 [Tilletiaria anomala UBC 951]
MAALNSQGHPIHVAAVNHPTAAGSHLATRQSAYYPDHVEPSHGRFEDVGGADSQDDESAQLGNDNDVDDDLSTTSGRRHGALLLPEPEDYLLFNSPYMTHWNHKRHRTGGNPKPVDPRDLPDWRMKERLRTITASLVMCLNIGVDPPDVSKTNPCSKLICWMDPSSLEVSKALPAIGKNLQAQFETLSMKTRYKQYLDPIVEEMKRSCTSQRRSAKDERVLFYYSGYGVPKPTPGGEIWVFNKAYTQYIPVTLYDLQTWLGSPCIYVWDASAAGNVVVNFKRLQERKHAEEGRDQDRNRDRDRDRDSARGTGTNGSSGDAHFPLRESIHLAACGPDEILPMNPDLPADLFTCCLTSPIEISLRWFVLQNPLPSKLNVDMVMNIPGRLQDRRTPLGELNWIFTAITDTIAWTVLPRAIFRRLFRDDLMVAALMRNFLLAERIMRFYHCTPMSHPALPETHNHPLWDSWDLAIDQCLAQLPQLLEKERAQVEAANGGPPAPPHLLAVEYRHSTFFSEQLQAFEIWLSQGGVSRTGRRRRVNALSTATQKMEELAEEEEAEPVRDPPEQLPIVLQVLLSQVHRLRALILLSQFLDLGPWAVNLALSIGIFPYVLKLLQSPAVDLKPVLIYIWARILAVDRSCQNDLLRDNGFAYFASVLSPFQQENGGAGGVGGAMGAGLSIPNVSEHRAMCAFILSVFCYDFPAGQQICLEQTDVLEACLEHLEDDDFLLRQWSALCLARLWDNSELGKAKGLERDGHGKLCCMLNDVSPEVRSAVLYALGTLLGCTNQGDDLPSSNPPSHSASPSSSSQHKSQARRRVPGTGSSTGLEESRQRGVEIGIAIAIVAAKNDCSPMVRKELVIALSAVVKDYKGFFAMAAYFYYQREERFAQSGLSFSSSKLPSQADAEIPEWQREEESILGHMLSKLAIEAELDELDIANISSFTTLFVAILDLSADAHSEVSSLACTVLDQIIAVLLECNLSRAPYGLAQTGNADGILRHMTPTTTTPMDDYFSAQVRVLNSSAVDLNAPCYPAVNGQHPFKSPAHSVRRSMSLAQTMKSIATLGYSRPSSPTGSSDHDSISSYVERPNMRSSAYEQLQHPAPAASNAAQYVSPYSRIASPFPSANTLSSGQNSPRQNSPGLATHSNVVSRSASAESLAHITSRPERKRTGYTSGMATPSPPVFPSPPVQQDEVLTNARVADTFAALVGADLHRFRHRHLGTEDENGISNAGHTPAASPMLLRSGRPNITQLDTSHTSEVQNVLPLSSRLFVWCSECYTEPQMKNAEANEPGSIRYNVQTWKRQRNERIIEEAQAQTDYASHNAWTETVSQLRSSSNPYLMLFHQFEDHFVTATDTDVVNVWDWKKGRLLSKFSNGNPPGTHITSTLFVNEDADTLLLVASADGNVRLYRYYDKSMERDLRPEVVSGFRALPELLKSSRPSGLIVDWQQVTGNLLAAGDSRTVRVWDAHRELCVCDIPTRASSPVTSLSAEVDMGHIFVAGFGDGTVGVYDRRNPPDAGLVRLWEEHQSWISKVQLQKRGNRELVSCSVDGEVRIWDIRGRSSLSKADLMPALRGRVSCFAVHERLPLYAA